jgi:quercetin dioxygenase-like cupin family protein
MPIYRGAEMQPTPDIKNPDMLMNQFGGELMKVGVVTYHKGDYHPNDEQFIYLLEGRAAFVLGDEITTAGPGDLIHIPRNTTHGIRVLDGPVRFFTCKSPSGTGKLSEDYTDVPNTAELQERLAAVT